VGTQVSARTFGPGLHVERDGQPLARAAELAQVLGGRLCTTVDEADALLDDLATLPALPAEALGVLGALAERVAAAERVVDRTVDRAAEGVGERMAATGTGMAIHPSAVRERAAAVLAAREAAAAAEERLRAGQAEAERAQAAALAALAASQDAAPAPAPSSLTSTVDEPPARRRRFFAFLRRREEPPEDTSESTSLLQQVAAATDEAFGQRVADVARQDHLLLIRAQRDRAVEDVRVAERAWRDLAGDDPVEDVESVVRRFDPQHQDALAVARETVGVRAVGTLLARAQERWSEGWREIGFDEPAVEPGEMAGVVARSATAVVLAAGAVERAEAIAKAAPAAPVVAVEPAE
jgi:hypothetical protein